MRPRAAFVKRAGGGGLYAVIFFILFQQLSLSLAAKKNFIFKYSWRCIICLNYQREGPDVGTTATLELFFLFSGCAADLQRRISSSYPCKLLLCVCVCLLFTKLRFIGEILFFLRPLNARRIISQALDSLPSGCPLHIYTHRGDRDAHTCVDRIIDPTTFSPYSF
jgi:hypothetical protein